ncbi:MAG: SDR family oxidoreductase, partial [Hyphomonadaceae bacterium]
AHSGVRVNAVAPGAIKTSGEFTYSEEEKKLNSGAYMRVLIQRRGTEAEVSAAIVFLLSSGAAFITGSVLRIDGGSVNARQILSAESEGKFPKFDGLHRPPKGYTEGY